MKLRYLIIILILIIPITGASRYYGDEIYGELYYEPSSEPYEGPSKVPYKTPTEEQSIELKELFSINLEILEKETTQNKLITKINLISSGKPSLTDVTLYYIIQDNENNIIYKDKETISINIQKEFIKEFDISTLKKGEYTLIINVDYVDKKEPVYIEKSFVLTKKGIEIKEISSYKKTLFYILTIIMLITICFMYYYNKNFKKKKIQYYL